MEWIVIKILITKLRLLPNPDNRLKLKKRLFKSKINEYNETTMKQIELEAATV